MKINPKNFLKIIRITKEESYYEGQKLVKYKNLVFEDENNGLTGQRVIYNNLTHYEKLNPRERIPGEIIKLLEKTIVKFPQESLENAIWNQGYKYASEEGLLIKLSDAAKKLETV